MISVSIIGVGRLGGALTLALDRRGYKIQNLVSRNLETLTALAQKLTSEPQLSTLSQIEKVNFSTIVLIVTPDAQIKFIAEKLAALNNSAEKLSRVFLHTSGALSSEVLNSLRQFNNQIGSLHPLVSVSSAEIGASNFKNAYFCVEGDAQAIKTARQIVSDLEGISFTIPTINKALYHAAAVMSSGHLVALFETAVEMLGQCGLNPTEAQKILLPLVQSTIENLAESSPAAALTGTFARADLETMKLHLAALQDNAPAALNIYRELGLRSLKLAAQQKADKEKLREMNLIMETGWKVESEEQD